MYYDIENYVQFVHDKYAVDIKIDTCRDKPTLAILEDAQEELLKHVRRNSGCCDCYCDNGSLEEAIYIMTYRLEYIGGANEDDAGYYDAKNTAYNYLMNRNAIYYG